jgi:GNAT superfamily N-acetyltransferase
MNKTLGTSADDLSLFEKFYYNVYLNAFVPDECISFERAKFELQFMSNDIITHSCVLNVFEDVVRGGVVFNYIPRFDIAVVEFIVVGKEFRKKGIAKELVSVIKQTTPNIIAEVDEFGDARKFWESCQFKTLDMLCI